MSFIYKLIDNVIIIKIFYIFLCSFLPLIFFFILKDKFKLDEKILFIFSLIIFLSPYFRSSAIWLLGDNLSLIFFGLSIYFFNKYELKNKFLRSFLCLFFLILLLYKILLLFICSILFIFLFKKTSKKRFFFDYYMFICLSMPGFFFIFITFF